MTTKELLNAGNTLRADCRSYTAVARCSGTALTDFGVPSEYHLIHYLGHDGSIFSVQEFVTIDEFLVGMQYIAPLSHWHTQ